MEGIIYTVEQAVFYAWTKTGSLREYVLLRRQFFRGRKRLGII